MSKKRIFISFAIEDKVYRDFIIGQSRNERSPFEFVDVSVKEPWSENWKAQCRTRIKGCDGMIALVSKNTINASGQLWEVKCAAAEGVSVVGVYTNKNDKPARLPGEFNGILIINWNWSDIRKFTDSL